MKKTILLITALLMVAAASFFIGRSVGSDKEGINRSTVKQAQKLTAIPFTPQEIDSMLTGLEEQTGNYLTLRKESIPNQLYPAMQFNPLPVGFTYKSIFSELAFDQYEVTERPANEDSLAFLSVGELAELIKARQIRSEELTTFYINRIKKYNPKLEAIVTLMEDYALEKAREADREIEAGNYKGMLHGIPFGAKDLLAKRGFKTTWGATPYQEQVIEEDATVIERLEEAGAILVAKTTLGALAWGDVWFGGKTRNPWNIEHGSSGSSAGSASTVSGGLLPFAIGSETLGSIVSPSTICGVTGLRPTYGRVSRHGAMALSWSMDKLGPLCRNVEDCAIVLATIYGPDGKDPMVFDYPFYYQPEVEVSKLRIGYVKADFEKDYAFHDQDSASLQVLRGLGAELIPIVLPDLPVGDMTIILSAEAAAAFDDLTRSNRDDELVRQVKRAWPNVFRTARFIPAVEYIQANRLRTQLIREMDSLFNQIDVYIAPSWGGSNLTLTNLSGHPAVVLPNGFSGEGTPTSITFTGRLFDEGTLLAVAKAYQDATSWHLRRPQLK